MRQPPSEEPDAHADARSPQHVVGQPASTRGFLRVVLGLGLPITFTAIVLLFGVGRHLLRSFAVGNLDVQFSQLIHRRVSPEAVTCLRALTFFGSVGWLASLGVLVAWVLLKCRHRLLLTAWVVALVGVSLLDDGLKFWFRRPRPQFGDPFVTYPAWNWSFPSGHATGSTVAYGMLAYFLVRNAPGSLGRRVGILALAVTLVFAICLSRVLLGVHYATDVLGGALAGGLWLFVCIAALESGHPKAGTRPHPIAPAGLDE